MIRKKMLAVILLVMLSGVAGKAIAQSKLPPFRVALTNGRYFTNKDLPGNTGIFLVYFSPDCDECREFTGKLTKLLPKKSKYKVLMVTNTSLDKLKAFYDEFSLHKYPNIMLSTEGYTNNLARHFEVSQLPFVASFNEKHVLNKSFQNAADFLKTLQASK